MMILRRKRMAVSGHALTPTGFTAIDGRYRSWSTRFNQVIEQVSIVHGEILGVVI
jgi:hypothetical protein